MTAARRPRALMFAPACFPRSQPEAHVNANLATALHDAGWDLHVITDPELGSWYPGTGLDVGVLEGRVHPVLQRADRLGRFAAAARGGLRTGVVFGGHSWAYPAYRYAMGLAARVGGFDIVLSRVLPGAAHLAGLLFSRETGVPWIANWNDPEPFDVKSPPPYGGGVYAPLRRGHAAFLARVGAAATWHTFPCERLRGWIRAYVPQIEEGRSSVVPHVARDGSTGPHAPPDDVLALFMAGSLRPPRSPKTLLDGLALFAAREPRPRLRLTFITDHHGDLRAALAARSLQDLVELRPPTSYEEAFGALAFAHVGVILEAPMDEGVYLPSKVVDYAQWGLPVLAVSPMPGTLSDLLSKHGGGVVADVTDAHSVAAALERLYAAWKDGTLRERYGSSALATLFSRERVTASYGALAERLMAEHGRSRAGAPATGRVAAGRG